MADIKKTLSELLIDYADNNVGNITPQLLRNGFKTVVGSMSVQSVSADYTLTEDDIFINANPQASVINITLPSAVLNEEKYFIIKNIGTYNVVLSGSIDSQSNYTLLPNSVIAIESDGSTYQSYIKSFSEDSFVKTDGSNVMTGTLKTPSVSATIIEFDTSVSNIPISAGQVRWNNIDETVDLGMNYEVIQQVGQEFFIHAHNETGSTILNGTAVFLTSSSTADGMMHVAVASKDLDCGKNVIAIATHNIENDAYGYFTKYGQVRNLNTEQCVEGSKIYLGLSGTFTSAQAVYPDRSTVLGYCVVSHPTSGSIYVSVNTEVAVEDLYNVEITTPTMGDSFIYENNRWINRNFGAITKESTGFSNPEQVTINYDEANRTITLSGDVKALYRSNCVTQLSAGWVSSPHEANVSATQFLYYDGSDFVWSDDVWTFDDIQIAAVVYGPNGEYITTLRESHGFMQWQTHQALHQTIGCYLSQGGDFSSFVLNSTTSANRRPDISETIIVDEDLPTTLQSLTTKTYTRFSLSGESTMNFTSASTDIVALNVQLPFYNQFTGGNWVQTAFTNNAYGAIFVFAVPAALDSKSQAKRFVFVQPQQISTSLATIQALTPNNVNLGVFTVLNPELVFIGKIIILASVTNFTLISVEKLIGTKVSQTAVAGNFLSFVTTDTSLSGAGTVASPLGAQVKVEDLTNVDILVSAAGGNSLVWTQGISAWQNYGNAYWWQDVSTKFYNKEAGWDSTRTTVLNNSASWGGGGDVSGSGTTNYNARWSGPTTLTSGVIQDDGTTVGIGTAPVAGALLSLEASTPNVFNVTTTDSTTTFKKIFQCLAPNATSGQRAQIVFGKAASTARSGEFTFFNEQEDDDCYASIGLHGISNLFTFTFRRAVTFTLGDNAARRFRISGLPTSTGSPNLSIDANGDITSANSINMTSADSVYTTVNTNSAGWESTEAAVQSNSATWNAAVPSSRIISAGVGLTGGGSLSADRTLSLGTVGTSGAYNNVLVDAYGRVTSGSNTSASGGSNLTPVSMRYSRTYATVQDMQTSGNPQNTLYDCNGGVSWVNGGYQNALSNYPGVVITPNIVTEVTVGMSLMQIANYTGSNLVAGATATFNVAIVRMTANGFAVVATIPLVFTYTGSTISNTQLSNRNSDCMFATAKVTGLNIPAGSLIGASYITSSGWRVNSDVMWTISYEG